MEHLKASAESAGNDEDNGGEEEKEVGVGDVCFFLTMRCFNDAMFSNS